MKNALINLLKVKTLLSLGTIGVSCYLAIKGVIDTSTFMTMVACIITYYFTRKDSAE